VKGVLCRINESRGKGFARDFTDEKPECKRRDRSIKSTIQKSKSDQEEIRSGIDRNSDPAIIKIWREGGRARALQIGMDSRGRIQVDGSKNNDQIHDQDPGIIKTCDILEKEEFAKGLG
jgi:hypothetical protein